MEEKIRTVVHQLVTRTLAECRILPSSAAETERWKALEDEFTAILLTLIGDVTTLLRQDAEAARTRERQRYRSNFAAYIDRTIESIGIHVDIHLEVPGGEESPDWQSAGHIVGLLRSEVESTISFVQTMRAIEAMFNERRLASRPAPSASDGPDQT